MKPIENLTPKLNTHLIFYEIAQHSLEIMLRFLLLFAILAPLNFGRPRSDYGIFDTSNTDGFNSRGSRNSEIRNALLEHSRRGGDLEHVDHEMERMNLVVDEIECKENSRTNMSKLKDLTGQIRKSNSMSRKMGSEFRKENRSILRRLQKMIIESSEVDL